MQNAIYPNNDFTSTSFLICIVSSFPVFLYFSLFLYVSPSSCLRIPLSHCLSFSIYFFFFFIFYLRLSMFVFRIAFFLYPSFAVFFFLYFFKFSPSFPSFFNTCYPNRCLPALSKAASASSFSFLPLFHSFCYIFLSDIPAFLFIFLSVVIYFHLPIFVSLSFFPQYFIAMHYKIIYKQLKHEVHVSIKIHFRLHYKRTRVSHKPKG